MIDPAPTGRLVIAHGIDVTEVSRVAALLERHPQRFVERVFTEQERAYCLASKRRDEHLAARFAAKEAVLKAIGTGWAQGIDWKNVEVTREPSGRPGVLLTGRALDLATSLGVHAWLLSLSHAGGLAFASAIALAR